MDVNQGKIYVVGISGASGAVYGVRLVKALAETGARVLVVLSNGGRQVLAHELGMTPQDSFYDVLARYGAPADSMDANCLEWIEVFNQDDIACAPASGSFLHHGMAVAPCSMKTLAAVASGYADNLLTRACDVTLKEKRPLILVPRETPFNLIHLENMTRAARAGAVILPPSPSFYTAPQRIEDLVDTVTARIMDHLGAPHDLLPRWNGVK